MSDTDGKKPGKPRTQKSSRAQPVKRSRKRQASRPPTIEGDAVRMQESTKPDTKKAAPKSKPKTPTAKTKAETVKPTPKDTSKSNNAPHASKTGFGYGTIALSALVGAASAAILLGGAYGFNVFSSHQDALEAKVAQLSTRIAKVGALANSTQGADETNAALKALKAQIDQATNRAPDAHIKDFGDRISILEAGMVAQNSTDTTAAIDQFKEQLDGLNTKITNTSTIADKALRQAATLEAAVKTAGDNIQGATDGTQGQFTAQGLKLAGFEAQIKRLEESLAQLQATPAPPDDGGQLEKTVATLLSEAKALKTRLAEVEKGRTTAAEAQKASDANTSRLIQRLSALEKVDNSKDISRRAAYTFALDGLIRAVETGAPFERDLEIVSGMLPQNSDLDGLQALAGTGIKTITHYQATFAPVLRAILSTKSEAQPSTGVMNTLLGKAKSLIKVRRVGDVSGTSREAIIARMEAHVKAGDLTATVKEAKSLEGPSAQAAAKWVQSVNQRLNAIKRVRQIRNDVIADLGAQTTPPATKE